MKTTIFTILSLAFLTACPSQQQDMTIRIDGSSTVFPLVEAVAEEFGKINQKVKVTVGVSGTGGGFKKFTAGEIDICNASRSIKPEEIHIANKKQVEYLEFPVAYDGITIVVNKDNNWIDFLTVEELKEIWKPDSKVKTWKDLRPAWPDRLIKLYGPGTDSGTFDYFTEVINGKARTSRSDYTKSEDDNVLVQGVEGDLGSLGYFGFSYYEANAKKIKAIAVKGPKGAVLPSEQSIMNNSYAPLSRSLYIYVNKKSLKKPEVIDYVNFFLTKAKDLTRETGFIALPDKKYNEQLQVLGKIK